MALPGRADPGSGRGHPRSVESPVTDLDDAIRQLRQAIFGLESRIDHHGLRHQVLAQCTDLSPVPEAATSARVRGQALLAGVPIRIEPIPGGTRVDRALPVSPQ